MVRICLNCGEKLTKFQKEFCNEDCRNEFNYGKTRCEYCGKNFVKKSAEQKFCTVECAIKYRGVMKELKNEEKAKNHQNVPNELERIRRARKKLKQIRKRIKYVKMKESKKTLQQIAEKFGVAIEEINAEFIGKLTLKSA